MTGSSVYTDAPGMSSLGKAEFSSKMPSRKWAGFQNLPVQGHSGQQVAWGMCSGLQKELEPPGPER